MSGEYVCTLDAGGVKRARDELGEIETDREAAVQALREWVLAQGDWLKSPTDTRFLLAFLRHRKFSQKAAKERLVQFWKIRAEFPDWFRNMDPASAGLQEGFRNGAYMKLPRKDKDGCTVFLARPTRLDVKSSNEDVTNFNRGLIAVWDELNRDDMFQVCGVKVLYDFTGVTIEHLLKREASMKRFSRMILNAYPVRIRCLCYYNVGTVFDLLFTLLRQLLPKKTRGRISTHTTLQTVYDKIDMSVLPVEYLPDDYTGPHAGPIDVIAAKYAEEMRSERICDYIVGLSNGDYGCDVTKQPDDVIPTESFRSLQL